MAGLLIPANDERLEAIDGRRPGHSGALQPGEGSGA